MPDTKSVTELRKNISHVVDEVVGRHQPAVIERNGRDHFLMVDSDDAQELLLEPYRFNPQVSNGESAVSIWLPEFEIYGRGEDFEAAKADLLDEVRDYVDEYLENADLYRQAPNRKAHYPYVLRALLAETNGVLEHALFPMPAVAPVGAA
jgi:hypothetical protein